MTDFPYLKPDGRTGTTQDHMNNRRAEGQLPAHGRASRPTERPQIDLIGESVALGPLDTELMPKYREWLGEFRETTESTELEIEVDPPELEIEFADGTESELDDVYFTVYELGSWRPIGGAALTEIDYYDQVAEFSIIIGETDARGKGYGSESTSLVLDYAFNALGLTNVMLRVYEYNYSARGAFQRAGFREFSRRRDCRLEGARLWDEIFMGCMSNDFNSSMGNELLSPENMDA